jgi:hypothetical protein
MDGQLRIDSLWAFTIVDDDGTEGVPAIDSPYGPMPMVGADLAMVAKLRPTAQYIATQLGKPVSLVHFSVRTVQETYQPDGTITKDAK